MSKGWIALNREITNHWIWEAEPYSKGQAWVDLLLHTNHTEAKIFIKGTLIELERGQQARSQVTLAATWKWSRDKVKRFLKLLEKDGMIKQKTSQLTSIITICNYKEYQHSKSADKSALNTPSAHQADTTQVTVNNVKNVNNEKKQDKIPYSAIAESYNINFAIPTGNSEVIVKELSPKRKKAIKTLWNLTDDSKSIDWFTNYFTHCGKVPNMMSTVERSKGWENWSPGFDYLLKRDSLDKAREGKL